MDSFREFYLKKISDRDELEKKPFDLIFADFRKYGVEHQKVIEKLEQLKIMQATNMVSRR